LETLFLFSVTLPLFMRHSGVSRQSTPRAKPREISYTSELVMKLERFELGAYAVLDRLTTGPGTLPASTAGPKKVEKHNFYFSPFFLLFCVLNLVPDYQ
jgi:hypothetical protein